MLTVLGGHVLATMANMATKTWPCHPLFRHPQGVTLQFSALRTYPALVLGARIGGAIEIEVYGFMS